MGVLTTPPLILRRNLEGVVKEEGRRETLNPKT